MTYYIRGPFLILCLRPVKLQERPCMHCYMQGPKFKLQIPQLFHLKKCEFYPLGYLTKKKLLFKSKKIKVLRYHRSPKMSTLHRQIFYSSQGYLFPPKKNLNLIFFYFNFGCTYETYLKVSTEIFVFCRLCSLVWRVEKAYVYKFQKCMASL